MANWPDLVALIQQAAQRPLGEDAVYTPSGDWPFEIRGIFSEAHVEVQLESGIAIESVRPVLSVHLADFAQEPARGDAVTVRGKDYLVREVRPDGEGDADLVLGVE